MPVKSLLILVSICLIFSFSLLAAGQYNMEKMDNPLIERGVASINMLAFEDARDSFKQAIKLDPNSTDGYYGLGLATFFDPEFDSEDALEYFDKALEIDPLDYRALSYKGAVLALIGNNEEAMKCTEKALFLNASWDHAWNNRGVVLYYSHNYNDALDCLDKAIDLDSDKDIIGDAYFNKGMIYEDLGRNREADEAFAKAGELGTIGSKD